jgi:hypothetical protein
MADALKWLEEQICRSQPQEAPPPHARLHRVDVGIGERHAAAALHARSPLEADGGQRHPVQVRIASMREGKGKNVVSRW